MSAPARRERLTELDALTDQIQPLLDRLDGRLRRIERYLGWRRTAAPASRNPQTPRQAP